MKAVSDSREDSRKSLRTNSLLKFAGLCDEKMSIVEKFESEQSFEMAYIARWSIIEQTTKHIAAAASALRLREELMAWLEYLEDTKKARPNAIRSFVSEPTSSKLPQTAVLVEVLGETPNLSEVLDTSKKFRKKRNAIAHDAEPFGSLRTYEGYKAKLEAATSELRAALQQNC